MSWSRIKPYGDDAYTYWIDGIYKVASYRDGEYLAFFMPARYENWGDHVTPPPDTSRQGNKCWLTLKAAQAACAEHAKHHTPAAKTVKRAAEVKAALIEQAKQYEAAA